MSTVRTEHKTVETITPRIVHGCSIDDNITGGGKGGGHGHTPVESPNTLRTTENSLTLAALGEGPIDKFRQIFFDDTDSDHIPGVGYNVRFGTSGQTRMPHFGSILSSIGVGVELTRAVKHQIDTTTENVEHIDVLIEIPALYKVLDTRERAGDMIGFSVKLRFETQVHGGSWVQAYERTISGKCTTPYKRGFRIDRPDNYNGFVWSVRVTRVSDDDADSKTQSKTIWSSLTEVINNPRRYPNTVLVGLIVDAKATGGNIPRLSFEVDGLRVKIPNNYDPTTHLYTGAWSGAFATALTYTNNPAWVLYDLITNTRYGLGVPQGQVDHFSFYNAAVFCDGVANYTDEDGVLTQGYRFTFNGVLQTYENAYQLIQSVASCMRAYVIDLAGMLTVVQDRPVPYDPVSGVVGSPEVNQVFTNANVIDGMFEYNSNTLSERYTEVNVTWNDRRDRYLQKVTTVPHDNDTTYAAYTSRYQRNVVDIAAVGCTNEGQAYRLGRWYLDNSLCTPENVRFRTSIENAFIVPGEVVYVQDEHYAGTTYGGRIVGGTTVAVTIDRTIFLPPGISYLSLYYSDDTVHTRQIAQQNGSFSTLNPISAFPYLPELNQPFVINVPTAAPRPFRISKIVQLGGDQAGQIEISGSFYDVNKYNRIDGLHLVPTREFSDPSLYSSAAPINVTHQLRGVTDSVNGLSWTNIEFIWSPGDGASYTYKMKYSREGLPFFEVPEIPTNTYTIEHADPGWYDVRLYSVNHLGIISAETRYQMTYGESTNPNAPPVTPNPTPRLFPPINIRVTGVEPPGYLFRTPDLPIEWDDPNQIVGKDTTGTVHFVLDVFQDDGVTLLATYVLNADTPFFTYSFVRNRIDHGGAHADRTITIKFYCRDAYFRRSDAATATFRNERPGKPTGMVTSGLREAHIEIIGSGDYIFDLAGFVVVRSTQAGFTPSALNAVYRGPDYLITIPADPGTIYYYKFAIFDTFFDAVDFDYNQLDYSNEYSSETLANAGLQFAFDGLDMTPNSPSLNYVSWIAGNAYITTDQQTKPPTKYPILAGSALWTGGTLFIYYKRGATTLGATTDFTTAIQYDQLVIAIYKGGTDIINNMGRALLDGQYIIAGTIGATHLTAGNVVITGTAQIANAIITGAHIQSATIDTLQLKQGTVVDVKQFYFGNRVQTGPYYTARAGGFSGYFFYPEQNVFQFITPNPTAVAGPFTASINMWIQVETYNDWGEGLASTFIIAPIYQWNGSAFILIKYLQSSLTNIGFGSVSQHPLYGNLTVNRNTLYHVNFYFYHGFTPIFTAFGTQQSSGSNKMQQIVGPIEGQIITVLKSQVP